MPVPTSDEDLIGAYDSIRDYIEEENRLVAERISRTLLVHGFLIASFVLLIQAKAQAIAQAATGAAIEVYEKALVQLKPIFDLADITLPLVAFMGVLTSLSALFGVMGATVAIRSLEQKARRLQEQHAEQWSRLCLPTVTGGGSDKAKLLGWLGAYGLIWLLIAFWAVVTAVSVSLKWWPALLSRF